jgi:hypothetical protein
MTRHPHRRTIPGAPRLIRRASLIAVAALAVAAAPSSAATGAQLDGDTLQIFGDNGEQNLAIVNQPNTYALDIGNNGTADFTFDRSTFSKIEVDAKGGNDRIDLINGGGALDKPITVDGGAGDDTLRGAAGAEKLLGGSGDDDIDGNIGNDTVDGGGGNDRIEWDPGDGSDTVDGASGTDALDFNGSNIGEQIGVTANGARARLTRNVASIDLDLGSLEQIRVRTVGGSDAVTVGDLRGTGVRAVSTDLRASDGTADGVADNVIVQGTDAADRFDVGATSDGKVRVNGSGVDVDVTSAETQDNVDVDTLGDADTVTSGVSVPGPGSVTVDGGDGSDTSIYKGTDGDDAIGVARNGTDLVAAFVDGGVLVNHRAVESLDVRGYGGADTIAAQNGIGTLTALTVDGGAGADTLRGGDGDDTVLGGDGDDAVAGGRGADTARLGAGDDHFEWNPGDGNDSAEGQSGLDTVDFNGSNIGEQIDLTAQAGRVRLTRNIASVTMDFAGIEASKVRTLGGSDQVTIGELAGTGLKANQVDLGALDGTGDGSADTVIVNGRDGAADHVAVTRDGDQVAVGGFPATTRISGSESLNDTLRINTLGGKDDVSVDPNAELLITPVIDLGAGQ